ncbi:uncharacterized protein LOC103316375 [Nasonia vitripennis]|uniref:CHK kinase-like domain-containing protein n=1 Tax=Nasonia vitripennis TaxID=7425 RepID=A0A7M7H602_NASVI|nr:uncharacterized protein LOC103316375 [Nasonia vitripennis]
MREEMLSSEEIAGIARRAFDGENVEVVEHQMSSHSKSRVGFLGEHQDLRITVRRDKAAGLESLNLFVKAVPQASEQQSKFIRERGIFKQEAQYFNKLLPLLRESYAGQDWCPKCFLASDKLLVLEDMRERGFAMLADKILDGEHLEAALRAQARLHAASLLAQAKLGNSPAEVYPEACVEQIYNEALLKKNRVLLYADLAEQVAQRLGRDHRRLLSGLMLGFDRLYRQKDYPSKLSPVFSHGDCWPNNYLFDRSQPLRARLVDFQLTRNAPRMFDVAHLTYLGTTSDIRRRELRRAIEGYHEELCDALERNNPELERPSLADLLEEYEDMKLSALFTGVMYYPIILQSKKELEKYRDDPELLYNRIMLRDNNRYVMELYDRDNEFASRINEIVSELIDYCEEHNIPIGEQENEV